MSDEAVHLLFSVNRWEMKAEILKDLEAGITLICDRYAFSGVAYSAAKGLDFEWCKNIDKGLIQPDITFYIDIDPVKAQERSGYGQERYERCEFQQ